MVPSHAKHLIYKHELPFRKEIIINKYELTSISCTKGLKLQTSEPFAMSRKQEDSI